MPVALLPSSAANTSSSTQQGGCRSTSVTPDGDLKPHSPTNNPRRRRYATEDDWRGQKDRISSLYLTKRLKDVIAVMETQYQFFATERMYKARFKEWGLEKNVTAAKVHKLMQRVEEEQQRRRSPSASGGRARNERVVLDVGEDLDVKRIQRYMKRKPVGLGKLRPASKRSLEVIKALSVDSGKGGAGRGKVSIPAVKLEQQNQPNLPESCLPTLALQWPPGPEIPDEIVGLLQAFIDNHFDCPYPFTPMPTPTFPPLTSSKWQPQSHNQLNTIDPFMPSVGQVSRQDETMLEFVLQFRIAHTLLDDGLASEGMQAVNACLDSLAFCIQQAQNTSPMDTRPATAVILWAFSAASDMMTDFKHTKLVLQMLLQRITAVCVGHQPTLAELAKRMCQLGPSGQVAMLNLARYSISQAMYNASEYHPAFETYSKTLSIAESRLPPGDKLQALRRLANDPFVRDSPVLGSWMETRIALSVPDASPSFIDSLGSYGTTTSPSWHVQGHNRMAEVLGTMAGRVEWHKAAGNWQLAQHLESRSGSVAQTVWGSTDNAAQGSGGQLDIWSSPEPMTSSLAPVEPSMFHMALPDVTLRMSHLMGEIPGWEEQPQPQPQPQQQHDHHHHQAQVPVQCEPPSVSVWNATDTSEWQLDANFENECGMYDGSYGEWDGDGSSGEH